MTHLDDLDDPHIEESKVDSATQYQDDFPLAVFSLNHISLAMIQPKSLSLSLLILWQAWTDRLSRITHKKHSYSVV